MTNAREAIVARLPPWRDLLVLTAILALSFSLRWPFRDVSLIRDEGEYAYAGQQILKGAVPYVDVYNQKTPFTFYLMALIQRIAGPGLPALRVATSLYGLATATMLYLLVRRLFGSVAGLIAALAFSLMTFDQCGITYSASTEFFMLLWMVVALYFWYRGQQEQKSWPLVLAGAAAGLAYQTKQTGLLLMVFFAVEDIASWIRYRPAFSGFKVFRQGLLVLLGFATVLGVTLAYFAWKGALADYVECTLTRNWQYVGKRHRDLAGLMALARQVPTETPWPDRGFWIWGSAGLIGLAIVPWLGRFSTEANSRDSRPDFQSGQRGPESAAGLISQSRPPGMFGRDLWILLVVCAGFALAGGAPFVHYWEPLIVPLSLGNALAARWLWRQAARPGLGLALRAAAALALVAPWIPPAVNYASLLNLSEAKMAKLKDLLAPFGTRQAAQYLADHTGPEETILIIGSEPEIYYYADRRACTRLVFTYPMTGKYTYAAQLRQEFLNDLLQQRPRYVLRVSISGSLLEDPDQGPVLIPLMDQLNRDYSPEWWIGPGPDKPPSLVIFRRKGS